MRDLSFREAGSGDSEFLRLMLFEALFVPSGSPALPFETVDAEGVAHYHRQFGQLRGDIGVLAVDRDAASVGAAWARQFSRDDPGYGFVDSDTPELTIATVPQRRGEGIGSMMLEELLAKLDRCSLSVDIRNPAVRLYLRHGFERWSSEGQSITMLWTRSRSRP